jgi:ACS family glucarate transporter-like MFS transporter
MRRREFIGRIATFNGALVFVAANALLAAVSYLVIVARSKRMVLVK